MGETVTSTRPVASTSTMDVHLVASTRTMDAHPVSLTSTMDAHPVASTITMDAHPVASTRTMDAHPVASMITLEAHPVNTDVAESAASQLRDSDVFQRRDCASGSSSASEESLPRQIHNLTADAIATSQIGNHLATEGIGNQIQQHSSFHENSHGQQQSHQQQLDVSRLP